MDIPPKAVRLSLINEVNYTSAIRIYAQYFVHPEDQAEYLQADLLIHQVQWISLPKPSGCP